MKTLAIYLAFCALGYLIVFSAAWFTATWFGMEGTPRLAVVSQVPIILFLLLWAVAIAAGGEKPPNKHDG